MTPTKTAELRDTLAAYASVLKRVGERSVILSPRAREGLAHILAAPASTKTPQRNVVTEAPCPRAEKPSAPAAQPKPAEPRPLAETSTPTVPPAEEIVIEGQTRAEKLAHLQSRVEVCVKCQHLASTRKQTVFGMGDPDAALMFIGEAPGAEEDEQGEPFVGRAGQLLTKIIETMGLSRETVYIANILKCRPDMPKASRGNRPPTADEMETCLPYLLAQIEIIQPRVIVALGSTAIKGLLPTSTEGITRLRGQWREFRGIALMPTFHPSFLLHAERDADRGRAKKRFVWEDMLTVMTRLDMPVSEKQQAFFRKK